MINGDRSLTTSPELFLEKIRDNCDYIHQMNTKWKELSNQDFNDFRLNLEKNMLIEEMHRIQNLVDMANNTPDKHALDTDSVSTQREKIYKEIMAYPPIHNKWSEESEDNEFVEVDKIACWYCEVTKRQLKENSRALTRATNYYVEAEVTIKDLNNKINELSNDVFLANTFTITTCIAVVAMWVQWF